MPEPHDKVEQIQPLDLVGPYQNIMGRIPPLDVFLERFFRLCRPGFFQKFRRNISIDNEQLSVRLHDDYLNSAQSPSFFAIYSAPPLRGVFLLQISGAALATIIDDLFGAAGMTSRPSPKDLTVMELRMAPLLGGVIVKALADAFEAYVPVQPTLLRTETHTTLATIADSKDPLIVMSANFATPCGYGTISVAIPYGAIEPHKDAFSSSNSIAARSSDDEEWKTALSARLDEAPIELSVEISTIRLPLSKLMRLKPGDILPLPLPRHAIVKENGVPIGRATFGATEEGVAFQCE